MIIFPSFHDLELDRQSIRILHGWKYACENLLTSKLERTAQVQRQRKLIKKLNRSRHVDNYVYGVKIEDTRVVTLINDC